MTLSNIIKQIEDRKNSQPRDAGIFRFDWNKPSHRFLAIEKVNRELAKLEEIEKVLNLK